MGGGADPTVGEARGEYGRRRESHATTAARWARRERALSHLRLAAFAVGAVAAWFVLGPTALSPGWLAAPALLFVALVVLHDGARRGRARAERAVAYYDRGLARLEDRWAGGGDAGEEFRDPQHPYALDLDVFGRGSLFELLCTTPSRAGAERLASWLSEAAAPDAIRARQQAIAELRPRLDLRERLALVGAGPDGAGPSAAALRRWSALPAAPVALPLRIAAAALPALSVAALAAWVAGAPLVWFELALLVQVPFALAVRGRVQRALRAVSPPGRDLALLAQLLVCVEAEAFRSPLLQQIHGALHGGRLPASRQLARLRRRIDLLDARRNQLFAPVGALLLWTTQLVFSIEAWRAAWGGCVGGWIDALADLEALCALAVFAYEHPSFAVPELVEGGRRYDAQALGHPLLPAARRVDNDVRLGDAPRVLMVSGSNMSGKSTLLRSVGVNAVLAQAGAPVCARRLVLSPLTVAASIRLQDSLLEGRSRFYAEVHRLRQIVALAEGARPVLFLLDEILHGTNSHDRGIGAAAIVRGLVGRGAVGLVTTHDLALAAIADELGPGGANVHFEDHLEDGEIAFDFRLRPGVVRKSNALALMRAVGLEV